MGWEVGGRFAREGTHIYLRLIHADTWQKATQPCKAITPQSTTHTDRKVSVLAKTLNQRNHARFRVLEAGLFLEWGITIGPPGRTGGAASDSSCFYLQTESDPSGVCRPGLPCLWGENSRLHLRPRAPPQGQYLVRVSGPGPCSSSGPGFRSPESVPAPGPPETPSASAGVSDPPPFRRLEKEAESQGSSRPDGRLGTGCQSAKRFPRPWAHWLHHSATSPRGGAGGAGATPPAAANGGRAQVGPAPCVRREEPSWQNSSGLKQLISENQNPLGGSETGSRSWRRWSKKRNCDTLGREGEGISNNKTMTKAALLLVRS